MKTKVREEKKERQEDKQRNNNYREKERKLNPELSNKNQICKKINQRAH